jgi:hypothetical protein
MDKSVQNLGIVIIGMVVAICAVAAHARLGDIEVVGDLVIPSPTVPTSPTDTGTAGQIAWDINYIYVCTSTNNWIRCPKDSSWVVVAEDVVYAGEDVVFSGEKLAYP